MAKSLSDSSINHFPWDCGSSLYDSFELKAFEHHLDSAISASSRTFSMPHLSSHRRLPPRNSIPNPTPASKIARALQRFIRSVFRRKRGIRNLRNSTFARDAGFYYVFYDKSGALSTIPEGPEFDSLLSPENRPLVGKSASERYTAATRSSIGMSCSRG